MNAQQRRVRIGVGGRAVHVGEPAHDRRAVHLDRQPGRHDDVDAAHHGRHLDVDDAGWKARLAQIQVGAAEDRDDAHPARHVPGPAAIDAAEDRVEPCRGPVRAGTSGCTTVGTIAGCRAAGASDVGQIGEQRLDVGGVVGRLRDRDPAFELVDVQRVVREVIGQPRDHPFARLLRPPDQRAVGRAQAGGPVPGRHARSVAPGRVGQSPNGTARSRARWRQIGQFVSRSGGLLPVLPIGLAAFAGAGDASARAGRGQRRHSRGVRRARGLLERGRVLRGPAARMSRARRAAPGDAAVRLGVRLTRVGNKVRGELRMMDGPGDGDTRRVEGESCDAVVEVLS